MTVTLRRGSARTSIRVQQVTGLDGQGKPTYVTPGVLISAYVIEKETKVERLQVASPGDEVQFMTVLMVDGQQPLLPDFNDRILLVDVGTFHIVVDRVAVRTIRRNGIDHVVCNLREE